MIQSDWVSSYEFQIHLKLQGCDITTHSDGKHVDIYNSKSEKIVTILSNGTIPPYEISMVLSTLRLKY